MRKGLERKMKAVISLWMKVFGLVFCLVGIASSPVYALWIGQSQLNPFLEIKGEYDSNIYRVNSDEDSDFVTIISPGIHYEYPTSQNSSVKAVADYRADIKLYGNNGDATIDPDEQLNTIDHRLGGHVTFDLASGWQGKAGYVFNIASTAPDYSGDTRNDYKQHNFDGELAYRFADRYKVKFAYDGRFKSFDESEFEVDDMNSHMMELTGFYQVRPKLSALAGGSYSIVDREEPFYDSTEYRAYGGMEYEATEKTTGYVKIGFANRQFDSDLIDDATDVYLDGHVTSDYQERTQWTLKLFRHYNDTAVSDQSALNGAYYISTGFGGNVKHRLASLPSLSFLGGLTLSKDTYPDDENDREDNIVNANMGIDYEFYKYLSLGAGYTYTTRDSNIDERNYTDHIATMKIRGLI